VNEYVSFKLGSFVSHCGVTVLVKNRGGRDPGIDGTIILEQFDFMV